MKLITAVNRALKSLTLTPGDQAAAELARHQAQAIDEDPDELRKVGPHLLETLAALGMTPKARSTLTKGTGTNGNRGKLAELRSLRP